MAHQITLLPGDGIGPEVTAAMKRCVEATGVDIKWDEFAVGEHAIKEFGEPMPKHVMESIRKNRIAIKGPITTPVGKGFRSVNVLLRQELDLYACVRPVKRYGRANRSYDNVDIVIFRENTEDLYAGIEFEQGKESTLKLINHINQLQGKQIKPTAGISIKPITIEGSERIMRAACEFAVKNKRKKLTIVHKANIMKFTDGLFLEVGRKVGEEYANRIIVEEKIVDAMCMELVQKPEECDVMVLPNLYGDIVSDLCAGLVGGLGIAPGANIGSEYAIFEPVHGSAPLIAGQNKANPTATILSAALMLRHVGELNAANLLEKAIQQILQEAKTVTADLKLKGDTSPGVTTTEMTEAICRVIRNG